MASYKGKTITPGTDAEVAAQVALIDGRPVAPAAPITATTTSPTIPVSTLAKTESVKPIEVVVPPPATQAQGLLGTYAADASNFVTNLQADRQAEERNFSDISKMLMDSITETPGKSQLESTVYGQEVDPLKAEVTRLNGKILTESENNRRRIEALKQNARGMTAGGLQTEIERINNESLEKQTELRVQQFVAQGMYADAREAADRGIAAMLESQKIKNDALQLAFNISKDRLTAAEQREFQVAQAERERNLINEEYRARARFDQVLQQSDPAYQLDLEYKAAQIADVYSGMAEREQKAQQALLTTGSVDAATLGSSPAQNNKTALNALLKSDTIEAGTRTQIANVLGVINAVDDIAAKRADGNFAGFNPIKGSWLGRKLTPSFLKGEETIENEGYVDAINLKVQQWASGASLTAEQIAQVNKLVPGKADSDRVVRAKLNNLTNFMLTQAATQLQSQGIEFKKQEVDLFGPQEVVEVGGTKYRVGSTVTNVDGTTGVIEVDGSVDVPDAPTGGGVSTIKIPQSSRLAFVNNNPGNLKFVGQRGAEPGEKGFARFPTPQAGFNALVNQIKLDASRGLSLAKFVSKFAPPTENNTAQYIQQIASRLGASPATPIAQLDLVTLAKEVARKESSTLIA